MFRKKLFSAGLLFIFLLGIPNNVTSAAPQYTEWATPATIPGFSAFSEAPYMIADSNGVVHAFHSQRVDTSVEIVYSTWDYQHGWTLPIDILLPPSGEALIKGVLLDPKGIVHLIFSSGDQYGGDIYYTSAPILEAGRVTSWSTPILIGKDSNTFGASLVRDSKGNLYVIYCGSLDGNGLYEIHSKDNGNTWSEPVSIYLTNKDEILPGAVALLMDENDELQIVWSNWKPPQGALAIYYSRLNVTTGEKTMPVLLDGNTADAPALIKNQGTLFLIYATGNIANGIAGKAMRQSRDAGRNWTNATWAFPPVLGGNGPASIVSDNRNNLYAFLGNRAGDCCHGMWYSTWVGDRWSKPRAIIQGRKTSEFDPYSPRAIVSQGNILLVTWWNENKNNGIWYSYAKLDEPGTPLIPLPTSIPSPGSNVTGVPEIVTTVKSPVTSLPEERVLIDTPLVSYQFSNEIISIGVILLLAIIIVLWRSRH
jgi:hypothetical protein